MSKTPQDRSIVFTERCTGWRAEPERGWVRSVLPQGSAGGLFFFFAFSIHCLLFEFLDFFASSIHFPFLLK